MARLPAHAAQSLPQREDELDSGAARIAKEQLDFSGRGHFGHSVTHAMKLEELFHGGTVIACQRNVVERGRALESWHRQIGGRSGRHGLAAVHLRQVKKRRDQSVVLFSRTTRQAYRLPDGTLFAEEPRFDAVSGRMESTWYWQGPGHSDEKHSSLRLYSATELAALLPRAGLRLVSVHAGCTPEPFRSAGPGMSARLGLLAIRD